MDQTGRSVDEEKFRAAMRAFISQADLKRAMEGAEMPNVEESIRAKADWEAQRIKAKADKEALWGCKLLGKKIGDSTSDTVSTHAVLSSFITPD